MKNRRATIAAASFLLAIASSACRPAEGPAEEETPISKLEKSKCGACHAPPAPRSRSRGHVEDALARHRRRVHLNAAEWRAMLDYLAPTQASTNGCPEAASPTAD